MPTGYTAAVADGTLTDFRTFALRCARNFGATIMQRDDPMTDLPKMREPSDYYERELAAAEAELAMLADLNAETAVPVLEAEYTKALAEHNRYVEDKVETAARYDAMAELVRAWEPPTSDHYALKRFMIDQLAESRKFDCDWRPEPPKKLAPMEWLAERTTRATTRLARAKEGHREELERCAGANAWITKLYESLQHSAPEPALAQAVEA